MPNFEVPPQETPQNPENTLESACQRVNARLRAELHEKYGEDWDYHNPEHSEGVAEWALRFLEKSQIATDEDRLLAETAGLGHDAFQDFKWKPNIRGIGWKRIRETVVIEEKSAVHGLDLLEEEGANLESNGRKKFQDAVLATIPEWDLNLKTIIQPRLGRYSPDIAWAVAAADIGSAGYDTEKFLRDGDQVFCEDNMLPALKTLSDAQAEKLYAEVLGWSAMQVDFAKGQKAYWQRDLVPYFVYDQMTEFKASIQAAEERLAHRKALKDVSKSAKENLQILLDDMGFTRYGTPEGTR
ncbi:MAG: HD domain-containing protein [Candidatus Moraniibacteriota bacterium]